VIERKIEALEDMVTKVSYRRSRRWLNGLLLIELVPRHHVEEIKGLFAPPPWGKELPLSAFCRTSVSEWEAFRSIDMDAEACRACPASHIWFIIARLMEPMKRSSEKQRTDEQVRASIENAGDNDALVLNVQDPFQRLLLHGVCAFYNITSTTTSSVRERKPWKRTTIKKRLGMGISSRITLVSEDRKSDLERG
ncbi:hypothetical protein U9M48_030777, partial [Paspalum notatum var. saurae]